MTSQTSTLVNQDPIASNAVIRPDHLACVSLATGRRFTYRELDDEVARCVTFLRGVINEPKGARVAFLGRNSIRAVELLYACGRLGAIFVPLNHRLTGAELKALYKDADPSLFIFDSDFYVQARNASSEADGRKLLPINSWFDYVGLALRQVEPDRTVTINAHAPWCILYSSGTTGRPKGVVITPHTAFHSAINFTHLNGLSSESVMLCNMPLFHVVGLLACTHTPLLAGAAVLIRDQFFPAEVLEQLADPSLGITHYFASPHMVKLIRREPGFGRVELSSVRAICCGGAPLSPSLVNDFLAKGVLLINGYGTTEAGTVMGVPHDTALVRNKAGSCGIPGPVVDVRLVDANGHDVSEGEIGEIWLRGPAITPGYWNQPKETAQAFCGGWLRTGDLTRRDADGFYYIVGRCKDMFISGGEKVYPAEVENVLSEFDGVADAAVIGVPDRRLGESGVAFVVAEAGERLSETRIIELCAARLARYKRPKAVRFISTIPRTASGKIDKEVLKLNWALDHAEGALSVVFPAAGENVASRANRTPASVARVS